MFGWDTSTNTYDKKDSDGRSYISAISEVILDNGETCNGRAKNNMGEARMDIEDSEIAYLGYHRAESYGISWKVGGEGQKRLRGGRMKVGHAVMVGSSWSVWQQWLLREQQLTTTAAVAAITTNSCSRSSSKLASKSISSTSNSWQQATALTS